MNILRHIYITAALSLCTLSAEAQIKVAPVPLITDNTKVTGVTVNADNLSITGSEGPGRSMNLSTNRTITVDFSTAPVTLSRTKGLVVYFGRYESTGAPTVVKVSGHNVTTREDDVLGYAYLLFRGGGRTHEFSNPVYGVGEYDSFTLEILEVSSGNTAKFYKFNLFAIEDGQPYPAGRVDPLHMDAEYYYDFYDYKYQPNKGILDPRNHYDPNNNYTDVTPWGENNTFLYDGEIYELPTFDKQANGQMPHVTEHTLYAMPGDMISLSPYYDLPTSGNYREKFSHWYSYVPRNADDELQDQEYGHIKDSRGNRLLDFLIDPTGVTLTRSNGYFAGSSFPTSRWKYTEIEGEQYFVIGNINDLLQFTDMVKQGGKNTATNAIVVNDIDCQGKTINKIAGEWNGADIYYKGKFNGNGHTIKNFVIRQAATDYHTGFFGGVGAGAEIKNLNLIDFSVSSGGIIGGLIGQVYNSGTDPINIENVLVNAEVNVLGTADASGEDWKTNISIGGGIIGLIVDANQTINLSNVGFVGTVTGGYGYNSHNGAFIGYASNNTVNFTNCYCDASIDRFVDGQAAVGHSPDATIITTNTKIDIRDLSEQNKTSLSQINFAYDYQAPSNTKVADSSKPIFQGKHLICVNLSGAWSNPHAYVWASNGNEVTKLFGDWPGLNLSKNNYAAYNFLTTEQWNQLKARNDWKIIINNNDVEYKTADSDFGDESLNDYFFDNVIYKDKEREALQVSKARTVLLHNPSPNVTYSIRAWNGDKEWYGVVNGVLTDEGDTYCFFNIPADIPTGNFAIIETYNHTSRVIASEEISQATTFIEYTPSTMYSLVSQNDGWSGDYQGMPLPVMEPQVDLGKYTKELTLDHPVRWYGTEATFYQPRRGDKAPDAIENLELEEKEYHVAADFGHEFNANGDSKYNVDYVNSIIHEPILNFRHIFHIKDGKTFADKYTTNSKDNETYLTNNSRAVSARANNDFQIRLSQQVPRYSGTSTYTYVKTNFYYKKGEGQYTRVPRVGLEITYPDGHTEFSEFRNKPNPDGEGADVVSQNGFFFDGSAATQGTRNYPDVENGFCAGNLTGNAAYLGGNGNGSVYRALFCPASEAKEGTYIVRLVALESDGITIINTFEDKDKPLYLDEYIITFLPDKDASVLTETELEDDKYESHRAEYLESEDVAGPPAVVVDFDQYRTFEISELYNASHYFTNHNTTTSHRAYKWPMLWQTSTYSFGYGGYYNYDFNEYIIANHSDQTAYYAAAKDHKNPDNTTGLYDRLWYDTYDSEDSKAAQMGYFYYVNAASDPGVVARLSIHNLCTGSTVAVSAWISEMSYDLEVANLSFNFVAVDVDNNREIVHSFLTGYIDNINVGVHANREAFTADDKAATSPKMKNHGEWVHVYYSFIPDLNSIQNLGPIDHYELELENNCVSSLGADYAVDDIRAYIISPQITARQIQPICDSEHDEIGIMIRSRFDKLLDSNGVKESTSEDTDEDLMLHFAVLDKKKYDAEYAKYLANPESTAADLEKAVKDAVILTYAANDDNVEREFYTTVSVPNNYNKLEEYDETVYDKAMYYTGPTSRVRYIQTNILPFDSNLVPGKEYYVVLTTYGYDKKGLMDPSEYKPTYADFAITDDPCAKYAVMTLQGSGVVKVDGIAYRDGQPVDVCIGQSPVVQVDLQMYENSDPSKPIDPKLRDYVDAPTHYYDWYRGTLEEFMTKIEGLNESYYDLLSQFRNDDKQYYATKLPAPEDGEDDKYEPLRELIEEGMLVLHTSSFVFPPLDDPDNAEHIETLTAVPIIPVPDVDGYIVCSQPNEIRLRVQNNSPLMFDGFTGIDYPAVDVPLRLGYNQLIGVETVGALTEYIGEGINGSIIFKKNVVIPEDARYIELPLREAKSYLPENTRAVMTMAGNRNEAADPYVYLAETDDPGYISLDRHPTDETGIVNSLLPIGMVKLMEASTERNNDKENPSYAQIVFSDQMKFREGYYYRVRFAYDEVLPGEVPGYCEGHVVFTVKVVPEYLIWTGGESRNWNNDDNWRRVSSVELLTEDANADDYRDLLTDGKVSADDDDYVNDNVRAFAPLDFTKVIISNLCNDVDEAGNMNSKGYPFMFTAGKYAGGVMTKNGLLEWNHIAESEENKEGLATDNIFYDMVSHTVEGKDMVACRPWYANTCEQIHFNHGAEMAHQESFIFRKNYQKAWVDMEMTGDRWYTLASPLQGVVAGDMYTKTVGGKQDNELFTNITFDTDYYGRYQPAVYQRGWNKAEAKTYLLGDNTHESKSAAVQLNWSRVYNDVDEDYAPGTGFSIRTATEGITEPEKDDDENVTVRFRLPKADDKYSYFDADRHTEKADNTNVSRNGDSRHALTAFTDGQLAVTLNVGTAGTYFLAGNPFMARMKMEKFLAVNNDVIEQAYWIMTSERQEATLWDEKSGTFISTDDSETSGGTVAPMQGFFVKAKTSCESLTLTYTPDMIDDGEIDEAVILRAPRAPRRQLITVTAIDSDGERASSAIIRLDAGASAGFDASEDAALLIDNSLEAPASVYTVASGQALAINSLDAIAETEVGLLTAGDTLHTLLFEGVGEDDGLRLLDTATGEISDLHDGMEVEVKGTASGRFYIIRPSDRMEDVKMAMVLKERTVSIVSTTDGITARVYTPAGLYEGEWSTDGTLLRFDLEPGIFIVEAVADGERMMRKFIVK